MLAGPPPPYLPSGRIKPNSLGYCLNNNIGWSCSTTELLMLGLMFRVTALFLVLADGKTAEPRAPIAAFKARMSFLSRCFLLCVFFTVHVWLLGLPSNAVQNIR